jgi:hypothetical protein
MLNNSQDGEWGGKKRSCFHLDFLIIEFCQNFPRMERQQDRKLGRSGAMKQKQRDRYQMMNKK